MSTMQLPLATGAGAAAYAATVVSEAI